MEINWVQQGNHGRGSEEFEHWAKSAIQEIKRDVATKQEAKQLAGSIIMTKTVRLQTEYMGTCRTRIMVHGVPMDISENWMGHFLSNMGKWTKSVLNL